MVQDGGVSAGLAWADYDGDGDPDLFVADYSQGPSALYRNDGDGRLVRLTEGAIAEDELSSIGGSGGDYDNDGDLDLFVANGVGVFQPAADALYRNEGGGRFERVENAATEHKGSSGGTSVHCRGQQAIPSAAMTHSHGHLP